MLRKLKALFESDGTDQAVSENDVQLAAASLMFELIRADGEIEDAELLKMRDVLSTHFSLDSHDVESMMEEAQTNAEEAISLQGFTRRICDNWDNDQRVKLLEYLWILALADNHIDHHERHLVRKVAGLLYLTDRQINLAKESAKRLMAD